MRAVAVKLPERMRSTCWENSPSPEARRAPAMKFSSSSVKKSDTTSTTSTSNITSSSTRLTNTESMPMCSTPRGSAPKMMGIDTMYCDPTGAICHGTVGSRIAASSAGLWNCTCAPCGSLPYW